MASLTQKIESYWDGISAREQRTIVLGGLGALAVILLYFGLAVYDGLNALAAKNHQLRRALDAMQTVRQQGGAKPNADGPELSTEAVKLESYLDNAAQKTGVTISAFTPRPETRRDGYVIHMMTVEPRGLTIAQARDLLRTIEQDNRTVAVTTLTVNRNFKDQGNVDLKIEVSAYAVEAPAGTPVAETAGAVAGRAP